MSDPTSLPTLAQMQDAVDALTFLGERAKRIAATTRWAGVVAVTEMVEGYDAAMRIVEAGPGQFLPDETDWNPDALHPSIKAAIDYVESGDTR